MAKKPPSIFSRRSFIKTGLVGVTAPFLPSRSSRGSLEVVPNEIVRPRSTADQDWKQIRSQFILDQDVTYMNNASLGMPPASVVRSVHQGYKAISNEPLHGKHDLQNVILDKVLPGLTECFGVSKDEIVLTRNASEALHLQAIGLKLNQGDEVIITTQEHPAGLRPWMFRKKQDGITVKPVFIPSPLTSVSNTVSRIADSISSKTKAISFCHVTRGGHLYPVKKLAQMARERGVISLVDGAQAVGQFPINLNDLGCDAYAASLHKWILAPSGTGFLYIRKEAREQIASAFSPNESLVVSEYDPPGTKDFPVRAGISVALDFINSIGLDLIEKRCRFLSDHLKDGLRQLERAKILSGSTHNLSAPGSTIFEIEGLDAMAAVPLIEEKIRTHIDEHQRDGHNAIRVSTHIYNTTAEIDRLINALT